VGFTAFNITSLTSFVFSPPILL